jgi:hypothetical protein
MTDTGHKHKPPDTAAETWDDDDRERREWGTEPTPAEDLARLSTDGDEYVLLQVARQLAAAGRIDQSPHADYFKRLLAKSSVLH